MTEQNSFDTRMLACMLGPLMKSKEVKRREEGEEEDRQKREKQRGKKCCDRTGGAG